MRIGSLFTGTGALDMAVQQVIGGDVVWTSDIDKAAIALLDYHYPAMPNLGDITAVDWSTVEPVDVIVGGFPCQDVSKAGARAGLQPGNRSGLWTHMAYAIERMRPTYVIAENVRGLLSAKAGSDMEPCPRCVGDRSGGSGLRALGAVLGTLADLRYDARWCVIRASEVGACHQRARVFLVATDALVSAGRLDQATDADAGGSGRLPGRTLGPGSTEGGRSLSLTPGRDVDAAADAQSLSHEEQRGHAGVARSPGGSGGEDRDQARAGAAGGGAVGDGGASALPGWPGAGAVGRPEVAADADRGALDGRANQPVGGQEGGAAAVGDSAGRLAWGPYEAGIRRWERTLGRVAPSPTQPGENGWKPQLSPAFVEWMMGLPPGHVTDVPGLTRAMQLRLLGNGVVPQQAVAAITHLMTAHLAGVA